VYSDINLMKFLKGITIELLFTEGLQINDLYAGDTFYPVIQQTNVSYFKLREFQNNL
jgi:hypothetical protein